MAQPQGKRGPGAVPPRRLLPLCHPSHPPCPALLPPGPRARAEGGFRASLSTWDPALGALQPGWEGMARPDLNPQRRVSRKRGLSLQPSS